MSKTSRQQKALAIACTWTHENHEGDYWETDCGETFAFIDGGPRENKMQFCPYCGRALKAKSLKVPA